ncbi:alpha-amylase family glycosyl hydrolase [Psychromonas sp. MME2]|uniref:alpha-amylase family glycosyl hydrolase n=1 Tax=Psychromonas sp. MME2 TaxID=3231033 RepID=UPI00339CDB0B
MQFEKSLLALALTTVLTACGGGGGGDTPPTPPTPEYQAYACDSTLYEKANQLRIYQVMSESFVDGNANADYNMAYGNSEHKGDIQGVIDSLDYIESLGMNAIWMTPIFQSVELSSQDEWADRLDGTGYFASNYFDVDPKFGTKAELQTLVNEAHARGIYVILDGVFGHFKTNATDYPSPTGLTVSTNGPGQSATGRQAVYPNDLAFFKEVASYWITEFGIDGWRLDQAYQVPVGAWGESRKTVEDAAKSVTYTMKGETVNPLGYMVGEIWSSAGEIANNGYGNTAMPGLCSNFDFPMRYSITQTLAVEESGAGGRDATNLAAGYATHIVYPDFAAPNGFLTNHDLVRFGDLLQRGNIAEPGTTEYSQRHKAAYALLAAYTGPITMYYGDEIGDEVAGFADRVDCANDNGANARAGLCDDHVSRSPAKIEGIAAVIGDTPFSADAEQKSLRDYITEVMNLRATQPALYNGVRTHLNTDQDAVVYIDHKQAGNDAVLFVLNTSNSDKTVTFTAAQSGSEGDLVDLQTAEVIKSVSDEYSVTLAPLQARFLDIVTPSAEGPNVGDGDNLVGTGPLADCNAADEDEVGPLGKEMWIRGTYTPDGFDATPDSHKFSYKGDNIYQVVVNESVPTAFSFKFAAGDWSSEFAVANSAPVVIASEQNMTIASGPGTESAITIPVAGDYVYSFRINANNDGGELMVSKCN